MTALVYPRLPLRLPEAEPDPLLVPLAAAAVVEAEVCTASQPVRPLRRARPLPDDAAGRLGPGRLRYREARRVARGIGIGSEAFGRQVPVV